MMNIPRELVYRVKSQLNNAVSRDRLFFTTLLTKSFRHGRWSVL